MALFFKLLNLGQQTFLNSDGVNLLECLLPNSPTELPTDRSIGLVIEPKSPIQGFNGVHLPENTVSNNRAKRPATNNSLPKLFSHTDLNSPSPTELPTDGSLGLVSEPKSPNQGPNRVNLLESYVSTTRAKRPETRHNLDQPLFPTKEELMKLGIMNLSKSFKISQDQAQVLYKGLTFVPTPKLTSTDKIGQGIEQFIRVLKLRFSYLNLTKRNQDGFHIPSNFTPHQGTYPPELDDLHIQLKQLLKKTPNKNVGHDNLTKQQKKALSQLKNEQSIVIKSADKGATIVIQDREDYVFEAQRQLQIERHYKGIESPTFIQACPQINLILEEMYKAKLISKKESKYLWAHPDSRERIFYLLPKIHKDPAKWSIPHKIPAGRPIVSDVNSNTYRISQFIDFHLGPYCTGHSSYVKNTYDFLDKLSGITATENSILISLDVESLYTNIDNDLGITAVQEAFSRDPKPIHPYIIKLLRFILEGNDFTFNGNYYLQISGVAMGQKFAPKFADICMAYIEERALTNCPKLPSLYLRYLDDILIIWPHERQDFDRFFEIMNSEHPNINLKANIQTEGLEFLDVFIYKGKKFRESGRFDTKVYFKPTDSHALLHKKSYHPHHTFAGIIKSQLIRFGRICNQLEDFMDASCTLFKALRPRGYTKSFLSKIRKPVLSRFFPSPDSSGMTKCNSASCTLCRHVLLANQIQSRIGHVKLIHLGNCNARSVIYVLGCQKCPGLLYVGQTVNLRDRLIAHRSSINRRVNTKMAKHFFEVHTLNDLFVTLLDKTENPEPKRFLDQSEQKWINKLDTVNRGLNQHDTARGTISIPFVLPYNAEAKKFTKLAQDWLNHWRSSNPTNQNPKPVSIIRAFAKNKNLSQVLVRSLLKPLEDDTTNQ